MTAADALPISPDLSPAAQDYLRAIYKLARRGPAGGRVTTTQLASWLDYRPASVTAMLQKMAAASPALVDYEKHHGVRLTEHGERAAVALVRHHRLLELFLQEKLGYTWDEVHDEADRLEHAVSDQLADRMAAALGNPTHDPHGHLIPGRDLVAGPRAGVDLASIGAGQSGLVRSVRDEDPGLLRALGEAGLRPGARVLLMMRLDNGDLRVCVDDADPILVKDVEAEQVMVELL